jgi:nucleoid-associated protein EbfC
MNLFNVIKQVTDIQSKLQAVRAELETLDFDGESGGGLVRITVNGKGDIRKLAIDPSLMKPGEQEVLEDLIVAAFTQAKGKSSAVAQEKMQSVTAGLPLPPGMKLF